MKVMFSLALRQLRKNRRRTLITVIGIVLSVAMLTAVAGFVVSTRDMMRQTYIAHRGDYHIGFFPVTQAQAEAIAADARAESSFTRAAERDGRLAVFFRIADAGRNYMAVANQMAADHGIVPEDIDENKELLAVEGIIGSDQSLRTMYQIAGVLGGIIIAGSVIVIANAFSISASERIRQFGVLKSAGATREQIRLTVLAEGGLLSVAAIPAGIAVGLCVEAVALVIANTLLYEVNMLNMGALHLRLLVSGTAIAGAAALSLVTVFLSAWVPAGRAAKLSTIEAVSLAREIQVRPRDIKTPRFLIRFFGFEGVLAAKALRRSRRKYRATVVSLVVSVVLFVLGTGFGVMIAQTADIVYKDFGVNAIMTMRNGEAATVEALTLRLAALPGEAGHSRALDADTVIPPELFTADARRYWGDEILVTAAGDSFVDYTDEPIERRTGNLQLIAVGDADLQKLCGAAGIAPENLSNGEDGSLRGIHINIGFLESAGRRVVINPFTGASGHSYTVGTVGGSGGGLRLALAGSVERLADVPTCLAPYVHIPGMLVVLPEAAFRQAVPALSADGTIPETVWVASTPDAAAYCEAAATIFDELAPDARRNIINYDQNARITRSINLLLQVFVLGFVGMLALIGVTSVLGTISTNITLRAPEFAMLSSVGMTAGGLRRMLRLESLFYGLHALAVGIPISLALYWMLYRAFATSVGFPFLWPWQSLLISAAAVMLITFATMRHATRTLAGKNTIEMIRQMNI